MIPLADLPSVDGVYVIHIDPPLVHARGYTGWAADIARRVAEHFDVEACRAAGQHLNYKACRRAGGCDHATHHPGSPLVCAAIRRGRTVEVAQVYPGGDVGLERRLHNRHHPRICIVCRSQRPPRPRQLRLPIRTGGRRRAASTTPLLWRFAHAA